LPAAAAAANHRHRRRPAGWGNEGLSGEALRCVVSYSKDRQRNANDDEVGVGVARAW